MEDDLLNIIIDFSHKVIYKWMLILRLWTPNDLSITILRFTRQGN